MGEESEECGDAGTQGADMVHGVMMSDGFALGGVSEVPKTMFAPEAVQSFSDISKRYGDALSSVAGISEAYRKVMPSADVIPDSLKNISFALKNLPDYSSMIQGMVPALDRLAKVTQELTRGINFKGISDAVRPIALKAKRVEILGRANWPMYLIDDAQVCDGLDALSSHANDEELMKAVTEIACDALGSDWLDETRSRWEGHDELTPGEKGVLKRALRRHEMGDYEGCVALLMNLFEGLIEKYCPPEVQKLEGEQAEIFDLHASELGLDPSHNGKGKARRLTNAKDKVLVMVFLSESGWYTFQHAADYIVSITLTNKMNADIAEHNPLRNKICHGDQTEYDSKEHSLKAILVADVLIRFGSALLAERADAGCDNRS